MPCISSGGRLFIKGMCAFYGAIVLAGFLLGDKESVAKSLEQVWYAVPFFMVYFLQKKYSLDRGIKWGIIGGSAFICAFGVGLGILTQQARFTSVYTHPNIFGMMLLLLIPFTLYYWREEGKSITHYVLLLLVGLEIFCLYKTGSRGAIVGLSLGGILAMCAVAWINRRKFTKGKIKKMFIAVLLLIIAGGGLFGIIQSQRVGVAKFGGERILMLGASYEMWKDHKLIGVGLANWEKNYYSAAYHPKTGKEANLSFPHNMPAYLFSTTGIIGGAGYLAFMVLSFWAICKKVAKDKNIVLSLVILTLFFSFFLQGLVDKTLLNRVAVRLYFALMGYYFALDYLPNFQKDQSKK